MKRLINFGSSRHGLSISIVGFIIALVFSVLEVGLSLRLGVILVGLLMAMFPVFCIDRTTSKK